jgi:hypothetical protein
MDEASYSIDLSDADSPLCILRSAPSQNNGVLSFKIALAPLAPCEDFPDGFLEKHRQTLIAGTLFALQTEEGKPYSRPQEAQINHRKWQDGLCESNVNRLTGNTAKELSVLTAREMFI